MSFELTLGKDHCTKGKPEACADLMRWRTTKLFVDSVFENPNHKAHEDEEAEACNPKVKSQGLQE